VPQQVYPHPYPKELTLRNHVWPEPFHSWDGITSNRLPPLLAQCQVELQGSEEYLTKLLNYCMLLSYVACHDQSSRSGRRALRATVDLAQHGDHGPVSRQEISPGYLAQLFTHLQAAGLVEGVKGPGGGYRLIRDPSLVHPGHVIQAVLVFLDLVALAWFVVRRVRRRRASQVSG
jgi:hypothetical protein